MMREDAIEKDIFLKKLVCGLFEVNCYLFGSASSKEIVIIDPGGCEEEIIRLIEDEGLKTLLIIATHGHLDHIIAIPCLSRTLNVEVACHVKDIPDFMAPDPFLAPFFGHGYTPFKPERALEDGEKITVGGHTLEVIHTPGHTPGSICLLCPPYLFSGDTLFQAGIGRTDLTGGNYEALAQSVTNRLWPLPDGLILLPGHGSQSTLGEEKKRVFF